MMILSIIASGLSIVLIGVDWYWSSRLDESASQLEALLNSISYGMSFDEFVSQCWMFVLLAFAIIWMLASIAFPKYRGRRN